MQKELKQYEKYWRVIKVSCVQFHRIRRKGYVNVTNLAPEL
jgi:hypothetical protein